MPQDPVFLAVDLGASSGRVMAGTVQEGRLELCECHRFSTVFSKLPNGYHWDVIQIYNSIIKGLKEANNRFGNRISGIAVDTGGVDYGLLDKTGNLLGNPFQYRDSRTDGIEVWITSRISRDSVYLETGIQFMFFNSIYQLASEMRDIPERLEIASSLLFMPDLFSYWLCGERVQERTIASTSQLWNPVSETWSAPIIEALNLPEALFIPVTEPGTILKTLLPSIQEETGLGPVPVIAVAGHDTGSAVAGTPLTPDAPVFLSSGTWSLMGIESPVPIINEDSLRESFSNEAGTEKKTRFLKNICGMWIIEQLRENWAKAGQDYTHDNLLDMAIEARPFLAQIDPDDARFAKPGDMPERIKEFCEETGQTVPETKGQLVRVVFESLACKYRITFEKLEAMSGRTFPSLRIVGGGSQNHFLNQCTADALNKPVFAGPVEATSFGNILMQMKATGFISNLTEGRALVETSHAAKQFDPQNSEAWTAPCDRLRSLL